MKEVIQIKNIVLPDDTVWANVKDMRNWLLASSSCSSQPMRTLLNYLTNTLKKGNPNETITNSPSTIIGIVRK